VFRPSSEVLVPTAMLTPTSTSVSSMCLAMTVSRCLLWRPAVPDIWIAHVKRVAVPALAVHAPARPAGVP